jgi:hypothetical protein
MNPMSLLISSVVAVIVSSITAWFFFGVLFHDKYLLFSGTWRGAIGHQYR